MDKILITRPYEDFKRTATALSDLGFAAISAPMMEFTPLEFTLPKLDDYAALVFTSANGTRAVKHLAKFKQLPCYVVGKQSCIAAIDNGYEILAQGGGDVVSLSTAIAKDYLTRGFTKPLLHISGVHMAGNLMQNLADLSIAMQRIQAYEMLVVSKIDREAERQIKAKKIAGILLYSRRSAEIFIENMQKNELLAKITEIPLFCLSKNIANALPKPYLKHIYFVDKPDEAALLALMHEKLKY